jgi:ABC-type spermidine/putrescine transport system permease subunit II
MRGKIKTEGIISQSIRDHKFSKKGKRQVFLPLYTAFFFLYIFAPIVLIFIFAWNTGEGYNFPLKDFGWNWFVRLFNDRMALKALQNSIYIAVTSATVSVILGTSLTIAVIRGIKKFRALILVFLMLPVLMPSLTIGISALVFFRAINIPPGIPAVIISHVSISLSYVFLIMMGRVEGIDIEMQESAIDLGANWFESLKDILFPVLMPAMLAGWLFSFMISWNEFIVTYFLIGTEITLPVYIFSQLRFGISPKVNVISVLITVFTILTVFALQAIRKIYLKIQTRIV